MQDKDFLKGYEIKNLDFGPRLYKFFAFAALINLIAIAGVGQTNMLARSACESPFVNRICSVLDTVYFSSKILTTDSGYVVKEYEETKIKESDVVWIDQTNVEPSLTYPSGYFQIANRDELAMLQQDIPGFPESPILPPPPPIIPPSTPEPILRDPLARKPRLPETKGNLIEGDLPDDTVSKENEDGDTPDNDTVADNKPPVKKPVQNDPTTVPGTAPAIEINKQPLYDFVDGVVEKVSKNQVDLRSNFRVVMNAYITDEGKLDTERSRWIPEEEQGDEKMILIAKDAVEKVGDSGWLEYFRMQEIRNVRIVFFQDEEQLAVDVTSLMPSENRARGMAGVFRGFIQGAIFAHNNDLKKLKDDEIELLRAAEVTNDRSLLKFKFTMKKEVAHPIINTRLREYQADKEKKRLETPTPRQPNGGVEKANARNRAR